MSKIVQGQSLVATFGKLSSLAKLLEWNLALVRHATRGNGCYFHADLHAGCGYNAKVRLPGSPLVFLDCARRAGLQYEALFVESDAERASSLSYNYAIYPDENAHVVHGENDCVHELLPAWIEACGIDPAKAFGTVFVDPTKPSEVPWPSLNMLFARCPKMDVIVNFPGTSVKRLPQDHDSRVTPEQVARLLNKSDWLIERNPRGDQQWLLMLGRNFAYGDYQRIGFVKWSSPAGQAVIERVTKTLREQTELNQMALF